MSAQPLTAQLAAGEAVLRFPYEERLRRLLRAIPDRRWDPLERVWRVPLAAEQAHALSRLLATLGTRARVTPELASALRRQAARRSRRELAVDLARPDERWWLSFATDTATAAAATLLAHPGAREVPELGRALVPLDALARELLARAQRGSDAVKVTPTAARALLELADPAAARSDRAGPARPSRGGANGRAAPAVSFEVGFGRDRDGGHWIVLAAGQAALARALAASLGLSPREAPGGAVGLAAREADARELAQLVAQLEEARVDPRVGAWLARATSWRGTIDVCGAAGSPRFLALGDPSRLPEPVRAHAVEASGGCTLPMTLELWERLRELGAWTTPAARRCAAALAEGRPPPPAVLELSAEGSEPTFVLAPGHDPSLARSFARLGGASPAAPRAGLGGRARPPALTADPFCVPELDRFLAGHGVWIDPPALERLQEIREEHARAAGLVALSAAAEHPLRVGGLGGELKPFQRAGVAYLLERRRAFLADEQGLGKTIEALAAIEADRAFPAIVVCPASLKLSWLRELRRWLPRRTVAALAGHGSGQPLQRADVTVLNYDIVASRLGQLAALAPRALVLDESHYCKNASAKRTQAVQRLAAAVADDGLILALTGTPVTNRPAELISQLRILGRLSDFGSGARFGERFRGPDAHRRLHWHLRARCFVRRLKADVLPQLPAKTRAIVPVELDNEPDYRLAERDIVAWLQRQPLDLRELDAKVAAALRAERLVRLGALKLLAARGKLHAALAWIHDFCSSGERLVVFARHREIQRAVLARFPRALHLLGEDSAQARERALEAFQAPDDGENQLIVCSIDVAGHGLTLTRASSVAFLELDWTPAKHDQAEDRCHRIGQQDAVNAYYLLAAGTVDESIAALLERKRAVIGAVTDGRDDDEEGVVEALARELRAGPYRHLRAVA